MNNVTYRLNILRYESPDHNCSHNTSGQGEVKPAVYFIHTAVL